MKMNLKQIINIIKDTIKDTQWENNVYLVGGIVRDEMLGIESKDIDLTIDLPNGGIEFANWFCTQMSIYKEDSNPVIFPRFGTAKFTFKGQDIECVMPRKEVYSEESRKPDTSQGTLLEDALRRDFTINSLFKNISNNEILDLTGKGLQDLKEGVIRTPLNPNITFFDDALRMLRCIRFSCKYDFYIDSITQKALYNNRERLQSISVERIQDELNKMLLLSKPSQAIIKLFNRFLLTHIIPEFEKCNGCQQNKYHDNDVFKHTMDVLDKTPVDLKIRLAALLHDIAKPQIKTTDENNNVHFYGCELESAKMAEIILKRLRYSNEYINDVCFLIKNHMKTKNFDEFCTKIKPKTIRKLVDNLGKRREMVFELIDADNKSHTPVYSMNEQISCLRNKIKELGLENIYEIKLPLNGNEIINHFNLPPSILIKSMLDYVRKICYSNPNLTKEEAFKILEENYKNIKK